MSEVTQICQPIYLLLTMSDLYIVRQPSLSALFIHVPFNTKICSQNRSMVKCSTISEVFILHRFCFQNPQSLLISEITLQMKKAMFELLMSV